MEELTNSGEKELNKMMKKRNGKRHPLFGKEENYRGSVASLDEKWHVRSYDVSIYLFGIRITSYIEEKIYKGPVEEQSIS